MDGRIPLALVFLFSVIVGAMFLWFGLAATLDTEHPTAMQTVAVSTTLTAESCPEAEKVGNGSCNAKVTVTDWSPFAAVALGAFMVVAGLVDLAMLIAVSV